jgi:RNA polymerase sigma-70 factor, ECF subfamily
MSLPVAESDEDLLRRSAGGDEYAFAELYERRQAALFRFALHMCGREDVAEEVTQEAFLILIRDPGRFDGARGTVASFLFGVARNHVLRHLEKSRDYVNIEDEDTPAAGDTDPLANMTREQTIEAVRQAVLTLPAGYREAVVLCDLEELSYADAASALDVPVGTVRSRLSRGRNMLLEKLKSGKSALRCSA